MKIENATAKMKKEFFNRRWTQRYADEEGWKIDERRGFGDAKPRSVGILPADHGKSMRCAKVQDMGIFMGRCGRDAHTPCSVHLWLNESLSPSLFRGFSVFRGSLTYFPG